MEHIEQAGVHSGDSGCSLPPNGLSAEIQDELRVQTRKLAKALNVVGLMNIQFAIQSGVIYILEVNPRARVPCRSSPRPRHCARQSGGAGHDGQVLGRTGPDGGADSAVLLGQGGGVPFNKFRRRTPSWARDEIHGRGHGHRAHLRRGLRQGAGGLGRVLPTRLCFVSVRDRDKPGAVILAQMLIAAVRNCRTGVPAGARRGRRRLPKGQ